MKLNLNADLGESFGAWTMGDDAALLPALDSASIACGFHAGDPSIIRQTVRAARDRGVTVGAHPAYPDLAGFGRAVVADDHGMRAGLGSQHRAGHADRGQACVDRGRRRCGRAAGPGRCRL